ncbi:hypothetical protein WICMUC_000643 [Wickerhamomyces mucosus]|uniref:Derlin n=1 Tax=Wickerhamomyces mucosus TaxID=1378264 RepID=A0A9P8PYF6_9ASCO|nr:hypothetical protein WICMUC_000643 [Wickerhamomyces mucosus]
MSTLSTGFSNVPISRYLTYLTVLIPLIASLTSFKYIFYLSYSPFIDEFGQYWRLLTSQLGFINESEVLISVILLYQFRALERLYSSHKYLSILIVLFLYNLLFVSIIMVLNVCIPGVSWVLGTFPSGPFGLIVSLFVIYKNFIPVTYNFEIYSNKTTKIILNDQFVIYLLIFHLCASQGWSSIRNGIYGHTIGWLVFNDILPGRNWRVPLYRYLNRKIDPNSFNNEVHTPSFENPESTGDANFEADDDDDPAETRPLARQFLDTFRG